MVGIGTWSSASCEPVVSSVVHERGAAGVRVAVPTALASAAATIRMSAVLRHGEPRSAHPITVLSAIVATPPPEVGLRLAPGCAQNS